MRKAYKRQVCENCRKISSETLIDMVGREKIVVCLKCVGKKLRA